MPIKRVDQLICEAESLAMAELEKRVRTVLRAGHKGRNPARSFCMAMGDATFYNKEGEPLSVYLNVSGSMAWADPTYDLLAEYDEVLHLTGSPMKIEGPDAPVRTDW